MGHFLKLCQMACTLMSKRIDKRQLRKYQLKLLNMTVFSQLFRDTCKILFQDTAY